MDEETARHTDEELFKQPPPREECPICFLPRPLDEEHISYQVCCGKNICAGCMDAVEAEDNQIPCPFCRAPAPKLDGELVERVKKRVEANDAESIYALGVTLILGGMACNETGAKQ